MGSDEGKVGLEKTGHSFQISELIIQPKPYATSMALAPSVFV